MQHVQQLDTRPPQAFSCCQLLRCGGAILPQAGDDGVLSGGVFVANGVQQPGISKVFFPRYGGNQLGIVEQGFERGVGEEVGLQVVFVREGVEEGAEGGPVFCFQLFGGTCVLKFNF